MGIKVIDLFKLTSLPKSKSFAFGKMPYIQRRADQNLERALDYYHLGSAAVKSNHILASLIHTANNIPKSMGRERYIELMEEASLAICGSLFIGTSASAPRLQYGGDFYGATEAYINATFPEERVRPWYEAEPVKVVEHQRTDITYTLLDGKPNTCEPTFSVIAIDLPALMLMYHSWRQWYMQINPDDPQSIPQFIHNWVLPGMIRSHNDLAFRNIIQHTADDRPLGKTIKPEIGIIANPIAFIPDVAQEIVERFRGITITWENSIQNIPMLTTDCPNAFILTRQAYYPYTKYGNLIRMLMSLGWMNLLATLGADGNNDVNTKSIFKLKRMLKRYRNERWVRGGLKVSVDRIVTDLESRIEN